MPCHISPSDPGLAGGLSFWGTYPFQCTIPSHFVVDSPESHSDPVVDLDYFAAPATVLFILDVPGIPADAVYFPPDWCGIGVRQAIPFFPLQGFLGSPAGFFLLQLLHGGQDSHARPPDWAAGVNVNVEHDQPDLKLIEGAVDLVAVDQIAEGPVEFGYHNRVAGTGFEGNLLSHWPLEERNPGSYCGVAVPTAPLNVIMLKLLQLIVSQASFLLGFQGDFLAKGRSSSITKNQSGHNFPSTRYSSYVDTFVQWWFVFFKRL